MRTSLIIRSMAVSAAIICSLLAVPCQAETCASRTTIREISAGWAEGSKPADDGNAVVVGYLDNSRELRRLSLEYKHNLNEAAGPSLLSLLLLAQSTGQLVSLLDNQAPYCDDFDEIVLHGY